MKIALGSDHRGNDRCDALARHLRKAGHEVLPLGENGPDSRDYPDSAWLVGRVVVDGRADRGVLVCGSGIGMAMAANKVAGVRAVLAHDIVEAEMSRRHNDSNVLCLPGDRETLDEIEAIVATWLSTEFEAGRHARRVAKMSAIEQDEDPATINTDAATR
ncbi:MAG: ribose 5-phosphate isomerase B [Planctomycetota bacterium]|jgi:ribose 5-phosphate isomerase B